MLVIMLAAGLWLLGWALALPRRWRWAAIMVLWLSVMLVHLVLPAGHALRRLVGGDAQNWLVLGAVFAVIASYMLVVNRLKSKATVALPQPPKTAFRAAELDRYARHIMLREIGGPGQRRLKEARVLVVGAGGLGAPALLYLAASGVGVIGVIDDDQVEASNLQRQIIHTDQRLGMAKVQSAEIAMRALNPFITVHPYQRRLTAEIADTLLADYDLILDGSDNFETRYLVNRAAARLGKPLISGAITQWEGQVGLYDPARGGPCYECIFPQAPARGMVPTCAEAGVAAPLPGVIGAMMAMEAVKHITGAGTSLRGRLMLHDALHGETRVITATRRDGCAACGTTA